MTNNTNFKRRRVRTSQPSHGCHCPPVVMRFLLNLMLGSCLFLLSSKNTLAFAPTTTKAVFPAQQDIQQAVHSRSRRRRTSLWFFNLNNDNRNNYNEGDPDLPLARYVDVTANYTLAPTPEDYIDLQDGQRLVCVGDVHGDLAALTKFLETAKVYDPKTGDWCGGNTILVQCGDILDRGIQELACYNLLAKLSHQALAAGGRLVLLIGNHEALNAMGLFQYAYSDIEHEQTIGKAVDETIGSQNHWRVQYVGNQPARWASYEPGGLLAHSLMKHMKVAIRVGRTVCVHAGLKPHHLKDHGGIEGMNAAFSKWISLDDYSDGPAANDDKMTNPIHYNHHGVYPPNVSPKQPWIDAEERQQFYINSIPKFLASNPEDPGPIWMREYSSPHDQPVTDPKLQELLDETLLLLDADRMVMGHTIQRRINAALQGKAWRVDVGASRGCISGTPEVLEIVGNREGPETVSILTLMGGTEGYKIPAQERTIDSYMTAALDML